MLDSLDFPTVKATAYNSDSISYTSAINVALTVGIVQFPGFFYFLLEFYI